LASVGKIFRGRAAPGAGRTPRCCDSHKSVNGKRRGAQWGSSHQSTDIAWERCGICATSLRDPGHNLGHRLRIHSASPLRAGGKNPFGSPQPMVPSFRRAVILALARAPPYRCRHCRGVSTDLRNESAKVVRYSVAQFVLHRPAHVAPIRRPVRVE
jgi:hypothetical protein